MMTPIKETAFAFYFEELSDTDCENIELLDSTEAANIWADFFDRKAKSLYHLSSESWLNLGPWSNVGTWFDQRNGLTDPRKVSDSIFKTTRWSIDEPLLFVQHTNQIISLPFRGFSKCLKALLDAFGDGPILMDMRERGTTALCFTPSGSVLLMTRAERLTRPVNLLP